MRPQDAERLLIARTLLAYVALLVCEIRDPDVSEASVHLTSAQARLGKALDRDAPAAGGPADRA